MQTPVFIPNTPDNLHCTQACLMMVMNDLGRPITLKEAERMTDFSPDLYTWVPRMMVELQKHAPGVEVWDDMDYQRFAAEGEEFFRAYVGNEAWFQMQKRFASPGFAKERAAARDMQHVKQVLQKPSLDEFVTRAADHLAMVMVDSGTLSGKANNHSHFILVYGYENGVFTAHDPGLPPREARRIPEQVLMDAYAGCAVYVPRRVQPRNG